MRTPLPLVAVLFLALVPACGGSRHQDPVMGLKSPDVSERRDAAHDVRDEGAPSPTATRALLEAIKTETDERAYGEMLISLGASGTPEAEPLICAKVYASDARARNVAKRALKLYLEHNRASQGCPPPSSGAPAPTGVAPAPGTSPATTADPSGTASPGVTIGPTK